MPSWAMWTGLGITVASLVANLYQWHLQDKEVCTMDLRRQQLESAKALAAQLLHFLNEGAERECAINTKAAKEWVGAAGNITKALLNQIDIALGALSLSPAKPAPSRLGRCLGYLFPLLRGQ